MSYKIYADFGDITDLINDIGAIPKNMPTALVRALNKTIKGAITDASNLIRRDYNLKAGVIKASFAPTLATRDSLEASLHGRGGYGIPMIQVPVTPGRVPSTRRTKGGRYTPVIGISARLRKDRKHTFPGYFTARMSSGHVGVFFRDPTGKQMRNKKKTAIREAFVPSPIKLLGSDRYDEEFEDMIAERYRKNLDHEVRHVLRQQGLIP